MPDRRRRSDQLSQRSLGPVLPLLPYSDGPHLLDHGGSSSALSLEFQQGPASRSQSQGLLKAGTRLQAVGADQC
jgi:hypothetical protein